MTETFTIHLPKAVARQFRAITGAAGTTPAKVLHEAAVKYVRKAIVAHIRARAGTWDGDISGEELLRRTRGA